MSTFKECGHDLSHSHNRSIQQDGAESTLTLQDTFQDTTCSNACRRRIWKIIKTWTLPMKRRRGVHRERVWETVTVLEKSTRPRSRKFSICFFFENCRSKFLGAPCGSYPSLGLSSHTESKPKFGPSKRFVSICGRLCRACNSRYRSRIFSLAKVIGIRK